MIFIAGNMPMVSEITPLLIITKLEQYDYAGATAIAVVMLVVSFVLLLLINLPADLGAQAPGGRMNTDALPRCRMRRCRRTTGVAPRVDRAATTEPPWVRRAAHRRWRWLS